MSEVPEIMQSFPNREPLTPVNIIGFEPNREKYSQLTGLLKVLDPIELKLVQSMHSLIDELFLNNQYDSLFMQQIAEKMYSSEELPLVTDIDGTIRAVSSRIIKKINPIVQKNYKKIAKSTYGRSTNLRIIALWYRNLNENVIFHNGYDLTDYLAKEQEYSEEELKKTRRSLRTEELEL